MTAEEQAVYDKVERALVESRPSFLTDGHGLRGPSPQLGQAVRSMDGADGGFGAMQVKRTVEEPSRGRSNSGQASTKEVIIVDNGTANIYAVPATFVSAA